jgi:hypothetical protein
VLMCRQPQVAYKDGKYLFGDFVSTWVYTRVIKNGGFNEYTGTQFTCFTRTELQILTRLRRHDVFHQRRSSAVLRRLLPPRFSYRPSTGMFVLSSTHIFICVSYEVNVHTQGIYTQHTFHTCTCMFLQKVAPMHNRLF